MFSPLRPLLAWLLLQPLLAALGRCDASLANGYVLRLWQTEDGLPQNMVTSAVQTTDGYLWLGTYNGLARFDGAHFEVFDSRNAPGLRDQYVSCLFEDAHGALWIGHESGAITRYRNGRFDAVVRPSGITGEKVIGIGSDVRGSLWAMRENGAVDSLDEGIRLPSLIAPASPGKMAWTRNTRGRIWVAENGRAAGLEDGALASIPFAAPHRPDAVEGIAATADGGVWVLSEGRIRKWVDGRWTEDRGELPPTVKTPSSCLELRDGTLAVGTVYSGLFLFFGDGREPVHFDRNNGLPQDWIRFLYEDREGNLWAGAGTAGLASVHTTAFSTLTSPDQWQGSTVLSVASGREGHLWVGTDGAGLYHFAAGQWSHYGEAEGLRNRHIPAVTETADGVAWAATYWRGSPYRLESGLFVRPEGIEENSSAVFALFPSDGAGRLLIGNRDGLLQLDGTHAAWLIKARDDSAAGIRAIARDRHGAIWCGYAQGGLVNLANGRLTSFRRADGLASDAVQCLLVDDEDVLWVGTDAGLCRYKEGRFATLDSGRGLVDSFIGYILDDGLGYLWLSTHHGLQRVAKDELNRCADGQVPAVARRVYDHSDGLPTIEFTGGLQSAGCKTPDGRLWFACSKGVVCVDPTRIEPNRAPPPVVIESLLVDGQGRGREAGALVARLPPDHQRLEFRYSGLSYVAPSKVLFKYRLEGIDDEWIDAGTRRTAFYSRLPAGHYRFRVIACNNDGVWNTEGAAIAFAVAPFFWQTWWFLGSGGLFAASVVALAARQLTRRRLQRKLERMERQHAIERERTRIAQDIHDDVGASLVQIAMLSQPAREDLKEPERAATLLARIYATAREVTRALDEIVWAVDPRHDTLDSLADYMGRFAQSSLNVTSIRCRLDLPVSVPAWPLTAEIRHNLFLAYKEALNNAIKHAGASEVRIALILGEDSFTLVVKDNGRGFCRDEAPAVRGERLLAGHGLANMDRRLAQIGGRCEITSIAGEGTTVSFRVPQAKSHAAEPGSSAPGGKPPPY